MIRDATPDTLVIGSGAAARGDDGFGAAVLAALRDLPDLGGRARLVLCDGDPYRMVELWRGFEHVIVVGTARGGAERHGYIYRGETIWGREGDPGAVAAAAGHGCGIRLALRLADSLGALPRRLTSYAVHGRVFAAGDRVSGPVAAVVPALAARIHREVLAAPQVPLALRSRTLTRAPVRRDRTDEKGHHVAGRPARRGIRHLPGVSHD
jgi:hydrogenase maturation protease